MLAEFIHNAPRQGGFGADDSQINVIGLRPFAQCHLIGERNVVKIFLLGRAPIAWRDINTLDLRRKIELPSQCMFATTTTDHEYFHSAAL